MESHNFNKQMLGDLKTNVMNLVHVVRHYNYFPTFYLETMTNQ